MLRHTIDYALALLLHAILSLVSVRAGLESVCYACADWLDEELKKMSDSQDTAGSLNYELRQRFLKIDGTIDESVQFVTTGISSKITHTLPHHVPI